jgi:hypothetical protein
MKDNTSLAETRRYRADLDVELERAALPIDDYILHVQRREVVDSHTFAHTLRVTQVSTHKWAIYTASSWERWVPQLRQDLSNGTFRASPTPQHVSPTEHAAGVSR